MAGNARNGAHGARKELQVLHKLERKAEKEVQRRDPVTRPTYTKGNLEQARGTKSVMSAWDQ